MCQIPDTRTYFIDATRHGKPNYPLCQGSLLSGALSQGTYDFRYVSGIWDYDTRFGGSPEKQNTTWGLAYYNGGQFHEIGRGGTTNIPTGQPFPPDVRHWTTHIDDRGGQPNFYLCVNDGQDKLWNNSGGITVAVDRLSCG